MRHLMLVLVMWLAVLISLGCGETSSTVTPTPQEVQLKILPPEKLPARVLWGLWHVEVDRSSGKVDIVPLRYTQFNLNVTWFLQPPFSPVHQMGITVLPSSNLKAGRVDADVTFKHPFPGLNQYRGFDVRGIFMVDGSRASEHDPEIIYSDLGLNEAVVLNPDGYTRWWNATEFTGNPPIFSFTPGKFGTDLNPSATLNPYKYYADDLSYDGDVGKMNTSNRGTFSPSAGAHTRLYKMQFPLVSGSPVFSFNYAVDASWEPPDPSYAPEYPIEAFGAGAQCQEAYHISADTIDSTLWFEDNSFGGALSLKIEVFDWQAVSDPAGVPGQIKAIWVESPVLTSPVDIFPLAQLSPGSLATSSVFEVELSGAYLDISSAGRFPILVSVESASPDSYQPQLPGGENYIFPDGPLSAYAMFTVNVAGSAPPVVTGIDPNHGELGVVLTGVIVSGKYFDSDAQVYLAKSEGGSPIEAIDEVVAPEGTSITCTIDLDPSLFEVGLYDVIVTNIGTGLSGKLLKGFEVLAPGCLLQNGFSFVESVNGNYGNYLDGHYDISGNPWAPELFLLTEADTYPSRYIHAYPDTDPVNYFPGSSYNLMFFAPPNGVEPVYNPGSSHPYCICILETLAQVVSTYEYFPATHTFTYLGDAGCGDTVHRAGCVDPEAATVYVLFSSKNLRPFHQASWGGYGCAPYDYVWLNYQGEVFDMVYCSYDDTIVLFTDHTPGGTLYKFDPETGYLVDSIDNVLPGAGHGGRGDVVIDNTDPDKLECRLVVLGGATDIYMARVLADFSDFVTFTYPEADYGVRCAALSVGNHRLFVQEYSRPDYIDIFDPPAGW